jgi:aspartate/methionine/tyrosine aminotransferase
MRIEPFALERWLLQPARYDLAGAGITKLRLRDVAEELSPEIVLEYGRTDGSELLRSEIAELVGCASGRSVLVTSGTAEANFLVLYSLLEPGDEFVTLVPGYMQTAGIAASFGAVVKYCRLGQERGYSLDIDDLERLVTRKTKLISVVNPNNPTGTVITDDEMKLICKVASQKGAWVLCDGALRCLEVEGDVAATPLDHYERGIATGSLSKIGLTGIRIGWVVGAIELIQDCWKRKDYTTLSHSGLGERLAEAALSSKRLSAYVDRARDRIRDHSSLVSSWAEGLAPLIEWHPPRAGHTSFPKYNLPIDSTDLCSRLLREEGVLVGPGDFFCGPGRFRLRHSSERDTLVEGLGRIEAFLRRCEAGLSA